MESVSLFVVSLFHLIMAVPFYLERKKDSIFGYYSLFCFLLFLWSFLFSITYLTSTPSWTLFFDRLICVPTLFIPAAFLCLSKKFTNKGEPISKKVFLAHGLSIILFLPLIFTKMFISEAYIIEGQLYFFIGAFYLPFVSYVHLSLILGSLKIYLFGRRYSQHKVEANLVSSGVMMSLFISLFFTMVLPKFGFPELSYLGVTGTIFLTVTWGIAITKNEISKYKLVISENIARGIVFLFSVLIYSFLYQALIITEQTQTILLLFVLSIATLHLVKAISPRISKVIFGNLSGIEKILSDITKTLLKIDNIKNTSKIISKKLKENLKLSFAHEIVDLRHFNKDEVVFGNFKSVIQGDLLPKSIIDNINHYLIHKSHKFNDNSLILPIILKKQTIALIILGEKTNKKPFSSSEISLLESIMNQIVIAFEKLSHQENLIKVNKQLLSEIQIKQKALDAAKDAAKYRTYSTLTKQISHEIRNPMSGLVLSADALEHKMEASNGKLDSEKLDKFFYQIRHISSRVFNILDAMLKYGKSGTSHKVAVGLKPILETVCVIASAYAKNNNVSINNKVNDSKFVMGNQTRLEQVFINLIKNAIEAHNKIGQRNEVIISAEETDYMFKEKRVKGVKVTVSDNGKGISVEELVHIFDPFYTNEKYEGTGLGLSVVHDVVEDHGGIIDVNSNIGQGTVMTIYLPIANVPLPEK